MNATGLARWDDRSWGNRIVVEQIGRVPFRMYAERPRRVEQLLAHAARWNERPHVLQGDRVVAFGAMLGAIANKAAALTRLGLARGDRVCIIGWNSPEWVANFWACLKAGAVPVLVNAWWSTQEIARGLSNMQPVLTLADDRAAVKMPAGARCGPWAMASECESGDDGLIKNDDGGEEEETALVIFTSGTSGQPKAVVLSHRAVLARLQMTLHVTRRLPQQVDESAGDVTLITGPLFHVGGMQTLLRAAVVGETLVFARGRFDAGEVLELIERHQVKRWNAVPTMVSRLLDHPDLMRRDLRSLKSISIGGAPVHAALMRRIREQLPGVNPRIPTGYGLTENGGQATAAAGSERAEVLGSSGKPLPCVELKFLPRDSLPDGEILLRSPTQMSGYFGEEASPIDGDGWLHTGDLGRLDAEGNLWITGRCKELIIRGGENIAPVAVERALLAIPGVIEAAVFGVPHPDLGEEVAAVVVVDGEHTVEQLLARLRSSLSSFAVPSRWRLQREPLPANDAGKVDKAALLARMGER